VRHSKVKERRRMLKDENVKQKEILNDLKREFEATCFSEFIPGIIHNFANPLNGIMGRSTLLQRRASENFKNLSNNKMLDEKALKDYEKIINDIELITKETNRLYSLFKDVSGKMYSLNDPTLQRINLSVLIEAEISFFDFYLDFKHMVKKKLILDRETPEVMGTPADYSIALSALIRHAMNSMKDCESKELIISTSYDPTHVCITIEDTGIHMVQETDPVKELDTVNEHAYTENGNKGLFSALSLLKNYGALIEIGEKSKFHVLSIRIPY
jgi:signal transduction histidine kinase